MCSLFSQIKDQVDLFTLLITEEDQEQNQILNEQRNDPFIQLKIQQLTENEKLKVNERAKLATHHRIKNGLLERKITNKNKIEWVIVLPESMVGKILKAYHDDPISGHSGLFQTYEKIKSKYYWPKMNKRITKYIQNCESCQFNKTGLGNSTALLKSIVVSAPFEKIGIDILGPLPRSSGKEYIIVVTEYFTRWVEMKALARKDAKSTAKFLIENILCRHGCPKSILSDQGRNFISEIVQEVGRFMNTKWQLSTAYHPQTNGLTERVNRTVCTMLTHYCQEQNQTRWTQVLPLINFAYNSNVNRSTQMSPFYLLYGREPILPIDLQDNPEEKKT